MRHSDRHAFQPRKPHQLTTPVTAIEGCEQDAGGVDSRAAMAVVGISMAPKSGQQRGCSEGSKMQVTSLRCVH
ncbi:hypothetical protein HPB50_006979 [Hyalomma asiaticum]|uniref:Uncharacterized protein n=1 Tax=Hyalomma asiaticum TaxID=266040 RepID=A0ACB7TDC6_HYAAI|nr:hypothetical protein HPB50_006979 [Hyalomma asiaticum]